MALRERPRNPALLALPVFGLSYYVFYIAIIRYNYDRFNLPLCVLLSFFGGRPFRRPWPGGRAGCRGS